MLDDDVWYRAVYAERRDRHHIQRIHRRSAIATRRHSAKIRDTTDTITRHPHIPGHLHL